MSESLTLGECRARLLANGYAPASLLAYRFGGAHDGLLVADDPPAVLTWPQDVGRRLCALVISTQDEPRRRTIWAALERRKHFGPVRTGSDGSEWAPFQLAAYAPPASLATSDGALVLLSAASLGPGMGIGSCAIPVAGQWRQGSLLDTPRSQLPVFAAPMFERLFEECRGGIQHVEPPRYIPTPPTAAELETEREYALLRKHPKALLEKLKEMRGNGEQQVAWRAALLCAVAGTGEDIDAARVWLAQALKAKAA
jgi:hypothetical protein